MSAHRRVVFAGAACHFLLTIFFSPPGFRNSVRLAIRKLTYAPEEPAPQPSAEATKEFMMSPGNLRLEASLDKEVSHSPNCQQLHSTGSASP